MGERGHISRDRGRSFGAAARSAHASAAKCIRQSFDILATPQLPSAADDVCPGHDRRGRLAHVCLAHTRPETLLRRYLLPRCGPPVDGLAFTCACCTAVSWRASPAAGDCSQDNPQPPDAALHVESCSKCFLLLCENAHPFAVLSMLAPSMLTLPPSSLLFGCRVPSHLQARTGTACPASAQFSSASHSCGTQRERTCRSR